MKISIKIFVSLCTLVILISGILFYPNGSYASENTRFFLQDYNKILFLVDISYSMKEEDSKRYSTELIQLFVDGVYHPQTDIGVIAYNDEIAYKYELTPMADQYSREKLKQYVETFQRKGSTDIGNALKEGTQMLSKKVTQENDRPIILVISDGQSDAVGQAIEEIEKDKGAAYQIAREMNCPIYTVGLNKKKTVDLPELKQISKETKGKFYALSSNENLLDFFSEIFTDMIGVKVWTHQPSLSTTKNASLTLNNPYIYLSERHFFTGKNINQRSWSFSGANDYISTDSRNAYLSAKLLKSELETVKIRIPIKGEKLLPVYEIQYPYVYPEVNIINNLNESNLSIVATLYDFQKETLIEDTTYFDHLKAVVEVTNMKTKEKQSIPMVNTGMKFESSYKSTKSDTYSMQVRVYGDNLEMLSPRKTFQLDNQPPVQKESEIIKFLYTEKEKEIQLNDIFTDADGDTLFYRLLNQDNPSVQHFLENATLQIQSNVVGESTIQLVVMDGRGGELEGTIQISIQNYWSYYRTIIQIILGAILLAGIILWLVVKKLKTRRVIITSPINVEQQPVFQQARFEGYFLKTVDGEEIPVLNWPLQYLEQRHKVSLGEMFAMLDVKIKNPESYNIYFEAGSHGKVLFYHMTKCIISIGGKTIPVKKKELLDYEDKIYILFEDHCTEIEVRYKRVNRNQFR